MRDQKIPKKKRQIFGAAILFLMITLALATTVMAANDRWVANGSYSLVIQKQFDKNMPEKVLEEAKNQTYRFRVEGYRLDKDRNEIPINEIVTIGPNSPTWTENGTSSADPWRQSATLCSDGPIHVSVTEITNDVTLEVDGQEYNMGNSRAETTTLFTETPQVRDLNSNGKITLSRPENKTILENGVEKTVPVTTTSFFRIRSEWPWTDVPKPDDWKKYDEVVKLEPGAPAFSETNLPAGRYTIEDLSVSGYQIQLGARTEAIGEGEKGTFYINSKPGKLVITAGGTKGDGSLHYYQVERISAPSDAETFVNRYTDAVASGETCSLENLPRGQYEVTEYESSAPAEFQVKVAETKAETVTLSFLKNWFGTSKASYIKFTVGGDYITNLIFGPLYNAKDKVISKEYTYDFGIRYRKTADQEGYTTSTWKTPRLANTRYSFTSPIYLRTDGTLAFAVWNVTAKTGDHVNLSWTENTYVEPEYTKPNANENYTFHVDDRGWIEITAPAAQSGVPTDVQYTYTLRKEENGPAVRTLTLKPGATGKIENLEAGSYLLMETVGQIKAAGFQMEISGDPFGSTAAGHSFELTVMDKRQLTIIKPKRDEDEEEGGEGDGGRTYTFTVERIGGVELETPFETRTVTLMAGEKDDSIELPAGQYRITPTDDMTEVFELTCSDTSQVHAKVPSNQAATVTFTNVFSEGSMGYRYVHEYYLLKDGKYIYEGNSPITTVGGRSDSKETYFSRDVLKEPSYQIGDQTYTYVYMPEKNAYGYVDLPGNDVNPQPKKTILLEAEDGEKPEENEILQPIENEEPKQEENETPESGENEDPRQEENETPESGENEEPKQEENGTPEPGEKEDPKPEENEALELENNVALQSEGNETPEPEENEALEPGDKEEPEPGENEALVPGDKEEPEPGENETLVPGDKEEPEPEENEALVPGDKEEPEPGENEALVPGEKEEPEPGENETLVPGDKEEPEPEENEALVPGDKEEPEPGENEALVPGEKEEPEPGENETLVPEENEILQSTQNMALTLESDIAPQAEDNVDGEGLWRQNQGTEKDSNNTINYKVDDTLTAKKSISVTEDKSQIIILRYFRVLPEHQVGSYNYVHVYYRRTPGGEVWEGTSEIERETGQLGVPYSVKNVEQKPYYKPENETVEYHYTFNERPSYGTLTKDHSAPHIELYPRDSNDPNHRHYNPNSDANHIIATKDGQEIIILRYYREIVDPTEKAGSYKVVHEYYFREKLEDQGTGEDSEDTGGGDKEETDAQSETGISLQADGGGEAADISSFSGTLSSDSQYAYTFEGARPVETLSAPLGSPHKDKDVEKQRIWQTQNYAYKDAVYGSAGEDESYNYVSNMEWASSTEEGDEIIILRYIRGDDVKEPEIPGEPNPPSGGGGGGGGDDPDPTPPPEEEIPEIPELSTKLPDPNDPNSPELPTELPDPNDPNSPEKITILENGVPRTYVKVWNRDKSEWVYIPEEDVPLWGFPDTGDESGIGFWAAMCSISLCGLILMIRLYRKRKDS